MTHAFRIVLLFVGLLTSPTLAEAESARKLVAKGNEAYRAGNYGGAVAAYERACLVAPDAPEVWFNLGDARYRIGDFTNAAAAFEQAALKNQEPALAARIQHNLGNCHFREAEREQGSDLDKAVAVCQRSIAHFQEALTRDAQFNDAAENLEVARRYLETLRDEINRRDEEKRRQEDQARQQEQSQDKQSQTVTPEPQSSDSPQNNTSTSTGSSRSSSGGRSSASSQAGQNQAGQAPPSQARSQIEEAIQQLRQRQQALRQTVQNQLHSGSQTRTQWSQQQSFSFQFGSMPGLNRGRGQPRATEPLTDQPQDILNEERENRRLRDQFKTRTAEQPVDKDW